MGCVVLRHTNCNYALIAVNFFILWYYDLEIPCSILHFIPLYEHPHHETPYILSDHVAFKNYYRIVLKKMAIVECFQNSEA